MEDMKSGSWGGMNEGLPTERPDLSQLRGVIEGLEQAVSGVKQTQQKLMRLTGEAWSDDRMVRALVGPRGHLVELEIDPRILRRPNASKLAATIVEVVRRAIEKVSDESRRLVASAVPEDLRVPLVAGHDMAELMYAHDVDMLDKEDR
jgi:DNA-binding protein YbaB